MPANLTPGRRKVILIKTSVSNIAKVVREAEATGRHTPGSWWDEGALHHAQHALEHLAFAMNVLPNNAEDAREELEHALCRAAMAMTCFRFGIYDDNGVEGQGK